MSVGRERKLREYGLTAGTLGANGAQTVMIALLPVLLREYAPSAFLIGLVIGSEGLLAILVPYWVGWLSDHLPHRMADRFGRRGFFLWAATPLMVVALVASPFLDGFWHLAAAGFLFFVGLHGYLTPLWALLIDAVPDERRAPVQGVRGAFQAAGLGFGLIGGGLLFALAEPLPFVLAAVLLVGTTWLTAAAVPADRKTAGGRVAAREESEEPVWKRLVGHGPVRWFLIANALWTGAVDGIRPYIFLFAVVVLGVSMAEASLVLAWLLVGLAVGAVAIGRLGNRVGRVPLLAGAAAAMALAMGAGLFIRDVPGAMAVLAVAGVAAAAFIALPFPVFASLAGEEAPGRQTALYIVSLGFARIVAPMLVGAAIDWGARWFPEYQGYPLMWSVAALLTLLSVPALLRSVALARREGREV